MRISGDELNPVLAQFNPWWRGEEVTELPKWHRAVFDELLGWVMNPPVSRAILLSGARQVGKTTLLLQTIQNLLTNGVPPSNIIYVTFDHPLIKLAGIDAVLTAWREKEIIANGSEYLFLDEAQFISNGDTWIKHQVDFFKNRRIIFTGSAMPLIKIDTESNVGRTHTIRLATLSFYEYLQLNQRQLSWTKNLSWDVENKIEKTLHKDFAQEIFKKNLQYKDAQKFITINNQQCPTELFKEVYLNSLQRINLPELPKINSLEDLFGWDRRMFSKVSEIAIPYVAHFHEYLARGGFPQTSQVGSIKQAQTLLREDIVDKVLKRDMTALFGVRRIQELEQTFLYLCMHDGGQLNMEELSKNLQVKKPTAKNFIDLLEKTHLIYRLQRFGYGKEVLRGREKIYLADAAIAPAVFLKGKSFLENPDALGRAIETAVFKHLYAHYPNTARFTYWQGKNNHEVDVIAEQGGACVPFEVKQEAKINLRDCRGLLEFCKEKNIEQAYIVTKSLSDFGFQEQTMAQNTKILKIPAVLFCYWLGSFELKNDG